MNVGDTVMFDAADVVVEFVVFKAMVVVGVLVVVVIDPFALTVLETVVVEDVVVVVVAIAVIVGVTTAAPMAVRPPFTQLAATVQRLTVAGEPASVVVDVDVFDVPGRIVTIGAKPMPVCGLTQLAAKADPEAARRTPAATNIL